MPRIGSSNTKTGHRPTNSMKSAGVKKSAKSKTSKAKKFDHTNFTDALKHSAKTGKPMVVKIGASWCGPCRAMNNSTFKDPKVQDRLNKDATFVNVEVDRQGDNATQRQAAEKISKAFGVRAYPTVLMATVRQEGDKFVPTVISKGNMMNAQSFQDFLSSGLRRAGGTQGN